MPFLVTRRDVLKYAALAPLAVAASRLVDAGARSPAPPDKPNVLLIVFDTLAAKHMSLYQYPRETTPNLARFAEHATVFHRHYSGGNFTSPGTSSLVTGSYPWAQRAFNFAGTVTQEFASKTLFRAFRNAGYRTVAYTHNWLVAQLLDQFRADIDFWKPVRELCLSDVEWSDRLFRADQANALSAERVMMVRSTFDAGSLFLSLLGKASQSAGEDALRSKWKALYPRGLPSNSETTVFLLEDAIDWIQKELKQDPQPFFAYFHLLPPHAPYNPRVDSVGRFDNDGFVEKPTPPHPLGSTFGIENNFRRYYDEFIRYADAEFGRLYEFLTQAGLIDNTYIVFTSDHGEMLERGTRGHLNPLLYEPIIRIPLLVSKPGQTERVDISTPTSAVDVLPTLAHIAGQPIPEWAEGTILPTFGGEAEKPRSIFALEAKGSAKQGPLKQATVSMVKDNYKLIYYRGYDKGYNDLYELYDLESDPEELIDLYSKTGIASELRDELAAKLEQMDRPFTRH